MGSNCTTTNKQCNLLKNRTESWPDRQQKSAASRYPAGFHHAPSSLRARGHLLLPPANNSCHSYGTPLFFCIFNIFSRLTRNNTTVLYSCLLFSALSRVLPPGLSSSLVLSPARLRSATPEFLLFKCICNAISLCDYELVFHLLPVPVHCFT